MDIVKYLWQIYNLLPIITYKIRGYRLVANMTYVAIRGKIVTPLPNHRGKNYLELPYIFTCQIDTSYHNNLCGILPQIGINIFRDKFLTDYRKFSGGKWP